MRPDVSPQAITAGLRRTRESRRMCLSLAKGRALISGGRGLEHLFCFRRNWTRPRDLIQPELTCAGNGGKVQKMNIAVAGPVAAIC